MTFIAFFACLFPSSALILRRTLLHVEKAVSDILKKAATNIKIITIKMLLKVSLLKLVKVRFEKLANDKGTSGSIILITPWIIIYYITRKITKKQGTEPALVYALHDFFCFPRRIGEILLYTKKVIIDVNIHLINVNGTLKYNNACHNSVILGKIRVYIPMIALIGHPINVNNG